MMRIIRKNCGGRKPLHNNQDSISISELCRPRFILLVLLMWHFRYGLTQSATSPSPEILEVGSTLLLGTGPDLQGSTELHTPEPKTDQQTGLPDIAFTHIGTDEVLTSTDIDDTEYWRWQPITWAWWTILQLILAVAGIIGNLLVITVIIQRRVSRNATDTLIGSLAIADLLTSIFLVPIPEASGIPSTWIGEVYCKVIHTARPMWISVSASVFTLTLLSVERFVGVALPFRFKDIFSKTNTSLYVVIVWVLALIMNSFAFFIFFVDSSSHQCVISFPTANGGEVLGIISFMLVLVNPVLVMLFTQSMTAYKLHIQANRFTGETSGNQPRNKSNPSYSLLLAKKRVIKLLFIINVTFVICWAPNQSAYLAFNLGLIDPSYLYGPLDRALVVLAFCNSCVNPIIYTIQHREFRSALKELFKCGQGESRSSRTPVFAHE